MKLQTSSVYHIYFIINTNVFSFSTIKLNFDNLDYSLNIMFIDIYHRTLLTILNQNTYMFFFIINRFKLLILNSCV